MITLTGKKVAEGIAVGRLTFYKRGKKEIRRIYVEDAKKEVLRFKKACEKAVQEIKELYAEMTREIGEANAAMFEMQLMVLEDVEYIDSVNNIIMNQKFNAEYAVEERQRTASSKNMHRVRQVMSEDMKQMCMMWRHVFCVFCHVSAGRNF